MLQFEQRLGESAIRLRKPHDFSGDVWTNRTVLDLDARSRERVVEREIVFLVSSAQLVAPNLTLRPRTHCLRSDLIKSLQPLHPIVRRVLQQQKRARGHVVRDVAQMPLATTPQR